MTAAIAIGLLLSLAPTQSTAPQHGLRSARDFSGRWVLRSTGVDPETARIMIIEQPVTTRNIRGETISPMYLDITIRRIRGMDVTSETHQIGVLAGFVAGFTASGEGSRTRSYSQALWEGDTLVFSSGSYTGDSPGTGQWTERREAWSLTADGTLSIRIWVRGSALVEQRQHFVYARQ